MTGALQEKDVVEVWAPRTTSPFDNLRARMREMFYGLETQGVTVEALRCSSEVLIAYEDLSLQNDPPITTFKGRMVGLDAGLPSGTMEFYAQGRVVGRLKGIW